MTVEAVEVVRISVRTSLRMANRMGEQPFLMKVSSVSLFLFKYTGYGNHVSPIDHQTPCLIGVYFIITIIFIIIIRSKIFLLTYNQSKIIQTLVLFFQCV